MSKVIGTYTDHSLNCLSCAVEGEEATAEALPEGFTCDSCWEVINA